MIMLNASVVPGSVAPQWGMLGLSILILATVLGNVLVCLAVCWETRLQSMANYFLVSLAIADLLVAMLVMPLGMLIEVYGAFPFDESVCVIWLTLDISLCTASIWHMCTMSMDRFFTLKYPMRYGRNKTRTMVAMKITFVWVVSLGISCPIFSKGFLNYNNVFQDGICAPRSRGFLLYGSILAFYVPLFIMVVTYILTIRILYNNQKLMKKISRQHTELSRIQFSQNGVLQGLYGQYTFLSPNLSFSQYSRKPSVDGSALLSTSRRASFQNSVSTHQESLSKEMQPLISHKSELGECSSSQGCVCGCEPQHGNTCVSKLASDCSCEHEVSFQLGCEDPSSAQRDSSPMLQITDASTDNSCRSSIPSTLSASQPNLIFATSLNADKSVRRSNSYQVTPLTHHLQVVPSFFTPDFTSGDGSRRRNSRTMNTQDWAVQSQPNLQSSKHRHAIHGHKASSLRQNRHKNTHTENILTNASSQPHLPSMKRRSHRNSSNLSTNSIKKISSILDLESVQNFDGLSACSSSQSVWSDFQQPVMLEKLSKIEAEMDLCLFENGPTVKKLTINTAEKIVNSCDEQNKCPEKIPVPSSSKANDPAPQRDTSLLESDSVLVDTVNTVTTESTNPADFTGTGKSLTAEVTPCQLVRLSGIQTCDSSEYSKNRETGKTVSVNGKHTPSEWQSTDTASQTDSPSHKTYNTSKPVSTHIKLTPCKSEPLIWRTISNLGTRPRIKINKHIKSSDGVMSKRTASNEKKASKVLGIIFCVFVALWTPFFIVNILTSLCGSCVAGISPAVMTTITWFGWLSSLGNPIIYTMFNTAFRNTFYKILTCKYTVCKKVTKQQQPTYTYTRASHTMGATLNRTVNNNNTLT